MQKVIRIALLVIFAIFFHWKWQASSIGLNVNYPAPLGLYLAEHGPDDEAPVLSIEKHKLDIPWTRYLPFFQFGIVEGEQVANMKYKDQIGVYTTVTLSDKVHRIAVFPDVFLRQRMENKMTLYLKEKTDGQNGHSFKFE